MNPARSHALLRTLITLTINIIFTIACTLIVSCSSGPEKLTKRLLRAVSEDDRVKIIDCVSDTTISYMTTYLDVLRATPETACFLISRGMGVQVDEAHLTSWTGESLLVARICSEQLRGIASSEDLEFFVIEHDGNASVVVSDGMACDTFYYVQNQGGWKYQPPHSEVSFSPSEVLGVFLEAAYSGRGEVASSLLDHASVSELEVSLGQVQDDPEAPAFLARHGIQLEQQELLTCTAERYLSLYFSEARLHSISDSLPDSIVVLQISGDSSLVSAYLHGEHRVARLRQNDGLWKVCFFADYLPLPGVSRESGAVSPVWTCDIGAPNWNFSLGQNMIAAGQIGEWPDYQDYIVGINPATGSIEWRRTDHGSSLYGISPDAEYLYTSNYSTGVVCASVATGEVQWAHMVDRGWLGELLDTGREVLVTLNNDTQATDSEEKSVLQCLNRDSGELLWEYELPRRSLTFYSNSQGVADGPWEYCTSSLLQHDGSVYLATSGSNIYRIDISTGSEIWRNYTNGVVSGELVVIDSTLIIPGGGYWGWGSAFIGGVPGDNHLYCLDIEDGSRHWCYTTESPLDDIQIAYDIDNIILFAVPRSRPGSPISSLDRSTGEELWIYPAGAESVQSGVVSMIAHSESLYISTCDSLCALDISSGEELWSTPERGLWDLTVAGNVLFGKRVTEYSYLYHSWGAPRPDYSKAYPSYDGIAGLVCIEMSTGEVRWEAPDAINNTASILVGENAIYVYAGEILSCYSWFSDGSLPIDIWD